MPSTNRSAGKCEALRSYGRAATRARATTYSGVFPTARQLDTLDTHTSLLFFVNPAFLKQAPPFYPRKERSTFLPREGDIPDPDVPIIPQYRTRVHPAARQQTRPSRT